MPSRRTILRRRVKALYRNLRGARMITRALASIEHPLLAHIIPIRRCNLACEYCNEFDDFSKPVPTETMFQRVDKLAELGTSVITISGGEPLLHPELDPPAPRGESLALGNRRFPAARPSRSDCVIRRPVVLEPKRSSAATCMRFNVLSVRIWAVGS